MKRSNNSLWPAVFTNAVEMERLKNRRPSKCRMKTALQIQSIAWDLELEHKIRPPANFMTIVLELSKLSGHIAPTRIREKLRAIELEERKEAMLSIENFQLVQQPFGNVVQS